MDKRKEIRTSVGFRTEILYNGNTYTGVIENLSASGANLLTDPLETDVHFRPYEIVDLNIESPEGEIISLKCTIMWSSEIPPDNVRHRVGVEIVGRPWDKISRFI